MSLAAERLAGPVRALRACADQGAVASATFRASALALSAAPYLFLTLRAMPTRQARAYARSASVTGTVGFPSRS